MFQTIPAIMTRKELSELLHISKGTLLRLIHDGKIEAFQIGNSFRFTKEAVEEFVERSTFNT